MKSAVFLCLVLFLSAQLLSQDEIRTSKTWEFGIQPSFTIYQLVDQGNNPFRNSYQENHSIGYQMGVLTRYRISEQWVLELYSGISFLEHEVIELESIVERKVKQLYYFLSPNLQYYLDDNSDQRWYLNSGTHLGLALLNEASLKATSLGNMMNIYLGVGHEWQWQHFKFAPQLNFHYSPVKVQPNQSNISPFQLHMISFSLKLYG